MLKHCSTDTEHSFRKAVTILLVKSGGDILELKILGGWKSDQMEMSINLQILS